MSGSSPSPGWWPTATRTSPWFAEVDRHVTPQRVTWIAGIGSAPLAGVFPIREVADLTDTGILSAFIVVCVAVNLFRYTRPQEPRTPGSR
ncbi:hypothetical protein [Modestobacter sp. URMC 112]